MGSSYALLRKDGSIYAIGSEHDLKRALWCVEGGKIVKGDFDSNWNGSIAPVNEVTKTRPAEKKKKTVSVQDTLAQTVKQLKDTVIQQQKQINELTSAITEIKQHIADRKAKRKLAASTLTGV